MEALQTVTLNENEFSLFIKALTMLTISCTDVEIKDNEIHIRTNDKVVTYHLKLPFQEQLTISLVNLPNVIKLLKTFSGQKTQIIELPDYYVFTFEGDVKLLFRKPSLVNNPYNKDKVQKLLNIVEFDHIVLPANDFNRIRMLTHKFNSDLLIDFANKEISLSTQSHDVKFTQSFDYNGDAVYAFKIIQHALPSVNYVHDVKIEFGTFVPPGTNIESVLYVIDSVIELASSQVPFRIIGVSELIEQEA